MAKAITIAVKWLGVRRLRGDGLAFKPSPKRLFGKRYGQKRAIIRLKVLVIKLFPNSKDKGNSLFPIEKQVVSQGETSCSHSGNTEKQISERCTN